MGLVDDMVLRHDILGATCALAPVWYQGETVATGLEGKGDSVLHCYHPWSYSRLCHHGPTICALSRR